MDINLNKCCRCLKQFKTNQNYIRHLQRKYPCKIVGSHQKKESPTVIKMSLKCNENVIKELASEKKKIQIYQCEACKKVFKHRQNRHTHLKTCKKLEEKNKTAKIKELNQKLREVKIQKRIVIVNKLE